MPSPLDTADLRHRVQGCLDAELATQATVLAELGPDVDDLRPAVAGLRGGKRLRAAFLYWGHRAAGRPTPTPSCASPARSSSSRPPRSSTTTSWTTRHPPWDAGRPPRARGAATPRAAGLVTATASAWPAPCSRGNLCLTWTDASTPTSGLAEGDLARGRARLRPHAPSSWRGSSSTSSSRCAVGRAARHRARSAGRPGHPLQERQVHRRASPAHRRDDRWSRRRRALGALSRYGLDLGRRVPAARRPPRRLRRPGAHGQARGRRPARGQAHRAARPRARPAPASPIRPGRVACSAARDLDCRRSTSCATTLEGSGAVGRARGRDRPARGGRDDPRRRPVARPPGARALLDLVDVTTARTA